MAAETARRALRPIYWMAVILVVLAALVAAALLAVNTDPGRGFIVRQIENVAPQSGLRIEIGRLEGSPLSDFTAYDVVLRDPTGPFLTIPRLSVDWRPFSFARNHLVVNAVDAPRARLLKLPKLNPSADPDAPLLPGFDITLGRLTVGALEIDPAVAGRAATLSATASADVADGRVVANADARTTAGDTLALNIESRPDDDRFDLAAKIRGPAQGLIANLAGLSAPVSADVSGAGAWSAWRGRLAADLGGTPLARADITAAGGRFRLAGTAQPGQLLAENEIVARLTASQVRFDAIVESADGRVRFAATAESNVLTLRSNGALDTGTSRLLPTDVAGTLRNPAALNPQIAGAPVAFTARLDGPLARLVAAVEANSARLAVGDTALRRPRVNGRFVLADGRIEGDARLVADAADGLGPQLAQYANRLVADARIIYGSGQIVARPLTIRTDRVRATGSAVYDLENGVYLLALRGGVARYTLAGIGDLAVDLDLQVRPGPRGQGLAVAGPLTVRALSLSSQGARNFLGGLPVITGALVRSADGTILLNDFTLRSPNLALGGRAALAPNGRIGATASGRSRQYGPVQLAVSGTQDRPRAELRLSNPGIGGLTNVVARIEPSGVGYQLRATGASPYGPLAIDARILTEPVISADIREARFAGLVARGRVQQAGAAFAGTLALSGSGITGAVRLASDRGDQRIDADLALRNARVPLVDPPATVGEGALLASIVLRDRGPEGTARLSAVRVTRGTTQVASLQASGQFANGVGFTRVTANGEFSDQPFRLAAQGQLRPDRAEVSADATVAGESLRLATPAVAVKEGGVWRLLPATLLIEDGRAVIAGTFGPTPTIDARLESLSLASLSQVAAFDVTGVASGSARLSLPPGGLPQGNVNILIRRFSRAGVAIASLPIDLEIAAAMRDRVAAVRGFVRRNNAVLGAFQLQLNPIPGVASDPALQRFLAAPMRGVVRVSAPAEAIWPLAGVETLDLRGPITLNMDISGRPGEPFVTGAVRANNARIESAETGTVITNVQMLGSFNGPRLTLRQFTGVAGDGRISGAGTIGYDERAGLTANLTGDLRNAQLLRTDQARATVTGPVKVELAKNQGLVSGDLRIDRAQYSVNTNRAETVPMLAVREIGAPPGGRPRVAPAPAIVWRLEVNATAPNRLAVVGLGLDSEWEADVQARGTAEAPRAFGRAQVIRGTFDFSGRTFELTRGDIRFQGENPPNPVLNIQATARVSDLTAVINITGTALRPQIEFTSTPALPQEEVLSRLLFGSSVTDISAPEAVQLAAALAQLRSGGGSGGFNPVGTLRRVTGLDRLRFNGEDKINNRGMSVSAGKYITRNVFVQLTTDAQGYTATQIEIALTRALSVLSSVQTVGSQNFAVQLRRDY